LPKTANSEKLGLGIDNPCRIVFLRLRMSKCLQRVNDRHFWTPGVFSYAMIPKCCPNSPVLFYIVAAIVSAQITMICGYAFTRIKVRTLNKLTKMWRADTAECSLQARKLASHAQTRAVKGVSPAQLTAERSGRHGARARAHACLPQQAASCEGRKLGVFISLRCPNGPDRVRSVLKCTCRHL
jgi:hypothetical protein